MNTFQHVDLGLMRYGECLDLQRTLMQRRVDGEIGDTLLLLEHNPVMTVGTSGGDDSLLVSPEVLDRAGVELHHVDRGGNITYHGPGELVGYPIFDLRSYGKDVHLFLRNLEQVVIDCLGDYGIRADRIPGLTGVWVGDDKICSIGLAVRRWVSYHGFAFNVNPNFEHWSMINPCGLVGRKVTSMAQLMERTPDMDEVKECIVRKFAAVFDAVPSVGKLEPEI